MDWLRTFCTWVSTSSASLFIQETAWIIPLVQTIHILCVAIVISSMSMLNLRLAGVVGKQPVSEMAKRFLPWLTWSVIILALTGTILIIGEPARELLNIVFRLKMVLLVIAITVTALFRSALARDAASWDVLPPRPMARVTGILSLLLWVSIIACGRWIAYLLPQEAQ